MNFQIPWLTRREFLKRTSTSAAVFSSATVVLREASPQAARSTSGKKGQTYPDQRRKFTDPRSGRTVWQLTDTPGRTTQTLYFTNRHATKDSKWLLYVSDRAGAAEHFDLYKMDLRTGESIQLTESGAVIPATPDISYDGKSVYFFEHGNSFRVLDLETLREREICRFDESVDWDHATSVSPDNRYAIIAPLLEKRRKFGYNFSPIAIRSALILTRLDNGEQRRLVDGNSPLGHVAFCPTDPSLVLYSIHGHWAMVQRPWLIRTDGTGLRTILEQRQGEGVGHEIWGASGKTVYASCYGGRQPQGLWASSIDGTNEHCVLAGTNIGHGTVNTEEDRYVIDELFSDTSSLWISKKGSPTPELLCKMKADWFETRPDGVYSPTRHHPHPRFLPNSTGVTFSSAGEIYRVDL